MKAVYSTAPYLFSTQRPLLRPREKLSAIGFNLFRDYNCIFRIGGIFTKILFLF